MPPMLAPRPPTPLPLTTQAPDSHERADGAITGAVTSVIGRVVPIDPADQWRRVNGVITRTVSCLITRIVTNVAALLSVGRAPHVEAGRAPRAPTAPTERPEHPFRPE